MPSGHSAEVLTYTSPTASGAEAHAIALAATKLIGDRLRFIISDVAIAGGLATRQDFEAIADAAKAHSATIGNIFNRIYGRDDTMNDAVKALNNARMCATRAIGAHTVTGTRDEWLVRMEGALAVLEIANARAIAHHDQQGLIGDGLLG